MEEIPGSAASGAQAKPYAELNWRGAWDLVVRRSQEVVELALKAALRGIGSEALETHDVGQLLRGPKKSVQPPSADRLRDWRRFQEGCGWSAS